MQILFSTCILFFTYYTYSQVYYPGVDDHIQNETTNDSLIIDDELLTYPAEIYLSNVEKQDFEEQAKKNVKALEGYIKILTQQDGSVTTAQKNTAHRLALELFVDENRLFEISTISDGGIESKSDATVSQYLNRVRNYNYDEVEITYTDIYISENLRLVSNNPLRYEGTISIIQTFKGCYTEGGCYEDVTNRNMIISVTGKNIFTGEGTETYLVVLLGDCAITQTYR
jgi:hypothetical protein